MFNSIQNILNGSSFSCTATKDNQTNNDAGDNLFEINGQIDDYSQGQIGDCWLLAGLSALSSSDCGQEVLQKAITQNEDGSYSIYFKGIDDKYVVTQEDLTQARESGDYSSGDDDVLLFELAFEKAFLDMEENPDKCKYFCNDLGNINEFERE